MTEDGLRPDIRWRVVAVAVSVTATGVFPGFLTAALAVQLEEDLSLGVFGLGLLIGLFFSTSALASVVMGRFVQRRGWAVGIRLAAVGSATALIGISLFARDAWSMAALLAVGGVAGAMSQPAANLALARSVSPARHGLLFGLKHTAAPAAAMLSGLAVPFVALTVGWRWAYAGAAVIALITAAATPSDATASRSRREPETRLDRTRTRILVLLAAATALGISATDALTTFIVAFGVHSGFSEASAGLLLSAGSVAALGVRVTSGWLVDRRQHAGLAFIAGLMVAGAAGVSILAFVDGRVWVVVGAVLGFGAGWGWSGLMTFVAVWANPEAPAAATGITHTGTYVGAAAGPALVGLLAEHTSFTVAWSVTAAAMGLAALVVLGVVTLMRRSPPTAR